MGHLITIKLGIYKHCSLLFLLMALFCPPVHANYKKNIAAKPFDTLKQVAKDGRPDAATSIYKKQYRRIPEHIAIQQIDKLTLIARELNDKVLESVVFDLKADYYAVNRGYNQLSAQYYQQAIDFANENNLPLQAALYMQHAGMFYYNFKQNTTACLYFLKAHDKFKEVGFSKVPNMSYYFAQVANFYYHLGDYANAKVQLHESLKYKSRVPRDRINTINTIGLIYRNYKQYSKATDYFNKALNLAHQNHDTVWVAITTGNIGSVYFMQKQYAKALPYIQTDYHQSLKYGENVNATIALLRLVEINLIHDKINEGLKQLNTAQLLLSNNPNVLNLWVNIYELKAGLYEKMGQAEKALQLRKQYENARDSLIAQNNIAAVEVVKMQWATSKYQAEETKLKANADLKAKERNTIFIISFLLIVISALAYSRQALLTKRDKAILLSEKGKVDEELRNTESKLVSYSENLKKNDALIESFKQQIDHLKQKDVDNNVIEQLEELMQAHIMTDEAWLEFRKIFLQVYPNFFFNLKKNFLYLSENDIRLLALIKLQLNNREMSGMLGITIEGVKKAKQRLRKKMGLLGITTIEEAIAKV